VIVLKHNNKASESLADEEWIVFVDAMRGERGCWPPSGISSSNGKRTPSLGGSQYPWCWGRSAGGAFDIVR
jgi:hypothetical protein